MQRFKGLGVCDRRAAVHRATSEIARLGIPSHTLIAAHSPLDLMVSFDEAR